MVDRIGLADTIGALRAELREAMVSGEDEPVHFPVGEVQIEFNVRVERSADAQAGVRFWVVDLGSGASIAREEVQRVTVTLGPPVSDGRPVRVGRDSDQRP